MKRSKISKRLITTVTQLELMIFIYIMVSASNTTWNVWNWTKDSITTFSVGVLIIWIFPIVYNEALKKY